MQRRVRGRAADDAGGAVRRVENGHQRRRRGAFPKRVKAATIKRAAVAAFIHPRVAAAIGALLPQARRLVGKDGLAAEFFREQTRGENRLVADFLRAEPLPRKAREQAVLGIFRRHLRHDPRGLAIRRARHDLPHEVAHAPRLRSVAKLDREPVEQFRVRRVVALHAEIVHRPHQPRAKELLPEPVHRHAREQRILRRDQPPGEAQPILRRTRQRRTEHLRRTSRDRALFVRQIILPARQDKRRRRRGRLLHHHDLRLWPRRSQRGSGLDQRRISRRLVILRVLFRDGIEVSLQPVEVLLLERIEFVIVTAAAVEREPKKRRAHGLHTVGGILIEILRRDRAAFRGDEVIAAKGRGQHLLRRGVGEEVSRDLLDHKTIKRQVIIEALDHPIPPRPAGAFDVVQVAIRVAIARHIQPAHRHPLAVARRRQQTVHLPLVGTGLLVREEGVQFLRSRRQPRQIESHAPQQPLPFRLRRRREVRALQARDDESVQ